jgi:superfamily II DNA helicase RecQ
MRDPSVMIRGFARPNIHLAVHSYFTDEAHKLEVIGHDVMEAAGNKGHGIVYGAMRSPGFHAVLVSGFPP